MFSYKVLNYSIYSSRATEKEKKLSREISTADILNLPLLQMRHIKAYPHVYESITHNELKEYTKNYMKEPAPGFNNMKRGEGFYESLVQLTEYLQVNDFEIYIYATDRLAYL